MGITLYLANKMLDHSLRGVSYAAPARLYLSLHTANPGGIGASEVSTGLWPSYTRQDLAAGGAVAGGFEVAAGGHTDNLLQMLFPQHNGAASVPVGHFGIWDALIGGNCLYDGTLIDRDGDPVTRTIMPEDEMVVYPHELDVAFMGIS